MARLIWDALHKRGYEVFMDVEDLRGGPYKTALLGQIESSNDIVVILTPNSLDRSDKDGDWLRIEISNAIKHNKNVIPVIVRGFTWPASLPGDIAALRNLEGLEPSHDFFDASIDRLARLLTAKPANAKGLRKATVPTSWPSKRVVCAITIGGIVAVLACGILIMNTNDRWLTTGEYQRQFDAKSAEFYPVQIQGRCP